MGLFDGLSNQSNSFFSFDPMGSQYSTSNANNAPTTKYDAPQSVQLNPEDAYNQALKYNQFASDQASAATGNAASQSAALGLQTKASAANIDSATKTNDAANAANIANNARVNSSGGGESFGAGAAPPDSRDINVTGNGLTQGLYNASKNADWQDRQNAAINSIGAASRQQVQGQLALGQQQQQADTANQRAQALSQLNQNNANRSNSDADRLSQQKIANTNAQASLASALFGAIGQRKQNNFWS